MDRSSSLGSLDKIRLSDGIDHLKRIFNELGEKEKQKAVRYINEKELYFASLFVLFPEIETHNLYQHLNLRNTVAMGTCSKILENKNLALNTDHTSPKSSHVISPILKWMLITGSAEDGLSNEYDKVLDAVASLLIITYQDKTVLPRVVDLIFNRNKKGLLIHDLIWCFYKACDPYTLRLTAEYLLSPDQKDVWLACKLLHLEPPADAGADNLRRKYNAYLTWLNENEQYLYFTGESMQLTSHPEHFALDMGAKYLCKGISPGNRKPIRPHTKTEHNRLQQFHEACDDEKAILSKYSHKIHNQNNHLWNKWMQHTLREQIEMAKAGLEGEL